MVTQQELDDLATRISDATNVIRDEVSALETQIKEGKSGNELDLTGLKASVGNLEGIEPPKGNPEQSVDTPSSLQGAAPTKADGTAVEHTEDPEVAKARANLAAAEEAARNKEQQTPQQQAEDAARSNV